MNITDINSIQKYVSKLKNVSCIIHLAAVNLRESENNYSKAINVNINGTTNMLNTNNEPLIINCVSCENKNVVFRTRDNNSAINILNLTECWINNQTRPVEFQCEAKASSFTCGNKKTGLSKTIGVKKQPRKSKHAC